jgi:hypothetical protein
VNAVIVRLVSVSSRNAVVRKAQTPANMAAMAVRNPSDGQYGGLRKADRNDRSAAHLPV